MDKHASIPSLSAEIFSIPLDGEKGRYLIYAPLRQAAFVANARTTNFLADLKDRCLPSSPGADSLTAFLRELQLIDGGAEPSPLTEFTGTPDPTTVTLFLTTACNLRCTYCYASAGDTPVKSMPLDVATRGIDFVARNAARLKAGRFEVIYHGGGEPTVNWLTLTQSLLHARNRAAELGLELHATTATNGVMQDARIDWIMSHLHGASVSFDGLPEVHDRQRVTAGGRGSSAAVIHTLKRFDAARFPYGIRVTVTADQIPHMADSVDYIWANFSPRQVQVEPAFQLGRWKGAPSAETEGFVEGYREAQQRAGIRGKSISFSGARIGGLSNHFCGVTQDSFGLSPDGNVSACYEVFSETDPSAPVFFYGRPDPRGGYDFDLARLAHLRRQSVEHRSFCQGCFAKWTCGGDCYHKSVAVHGTEPFAGSDRCHIIRELTKDQILDRIAACGGVVWKHDPDDDDSETCSSGKEMLL